MTPVDEIPVLKLSNLVKMYNANLEKFRINLVTRIHSTQFKSRLLSQFQDLPAHSSKKEVILAFKFNVGDAISTAAKADFNDDDYILARAACEET